MRRIIESSLSREQNKDFIGREVVLEKEGRRYNGFLLGSTATISNGKWVSIYHGEMRNVGKLALAGVGERSFIKQLDLISSW